MARSAYRQAVQLSSPGKPVVGVGVTCSLRSTGEKRGDHKIFVSSFCGCTLRTYSITLLKGERTRAQEDTLASLVVLQALAYASGHSHLLVEQGLQTGEYVEVCAVTTAHLVEGAVDGRYVYVGLDEHIVVGRWTAALFCFSLGISSECEPAG